ncbi:MAG: alpha/beta fold hydrolase [Anaerolineales bacterium]|nr:alpha/beta fold hydrolase [Anaerolineales bacterium]
MSLFQRVLRFLFLLAGFVAGLLTTVAAIFAQRLIKPPRQRLWATPADLGLDYEDVQFPAQDGVRLSGWFIPGAAATQRKGATIVLVHGWPWNRLGEAAVDPISTFTGATPVDLLRLAYALHQDGFHVFSFDLRNHGESAAAAPMTFGQMEANDLLGALAYLNGRSDVARNRMGVIGFSMGANTVLYTLPQTELVQAAIAVQPTTPSVFANRLARYLLGSFGGPVMRLTETIYQAAGGTRLNAYQPAFAAAGAGETPVLYVQGNGDEWGSMEDVARIAAVTPEARGPLFVEALHRFGGYQYLVDNPKIATSFFEQHLPE